MHIAKLVQYEEMSAEIDVNIANLILLCWKLNIFTFLSCEDNVPSGWIWINFCSAQDLEKFISIISSNRDNEIYNRIYPKYGFNQEIEDCGWRYDLDIVDSGMDEQIIIKDGKEYVEDIPLMETNAIIVPSVRFPQSDQEYVEMMLKLELEKINANISSCR